MKITKITQKVHKTPVPTYCFNEPQNHECLVVGKSGKSYASFQSVNFGLLFRGSARVIAPDIDNWPDTRIEEYLTKKEVYGKMDYDITRKSYEKLKQDSPRQFKVHCIAQDMRNTFLSTYSCLPLWHEANDAFLREYGYIESIHGIKRHIPEAIYQGRDSNQKKVNSQGNISVNSPTQAFEAIEVYKAMIRCHGRLKRENLKSKIIAMIHDSLTFKTYITEIRDVYKILKEEMQNISEFPIPLTIDVQIGKVMGFGEDINDSNIDALVEKYSKDS